MVGVTGVRSNGSKWSLLAAAFSVVGSNIAWYNT